MAVIVLRDGTTTCTSTRTSSSKSNGNSSSGCSEINISSNS